MNKSKLSTSVEQGLRAGAGAAVPLHLYQQRWFLDRSRFKIGMFSRQTGKTFTSTLEIADDMWAAEAQGKRSPWVILSRGERQAKEAIETLKMHLKAYSIAVEVIESEYTREVNGKVVTETQFEVKLPGGSWCKALPANPDTARGFSANVFLDEFAFHADSKKIWGALFPVISKGWRIIVTSTPNGKGNKFYELMTKKESVWSRHIVDIYKAVKEGLDRNIQELKDGLDDDDMWAQEFELEWMDEASAWLSYDLINSVEDKHANCLEYLAALNGNYFIGNDIARRNDLWCAWVMKKIGDVLWSVELRTLKNKTFAVHDQTLDELVEKYNPVRIAMDQGGMGEKPVEDAKRRYGEYVVEGVIFTNTIKQNLATLAKQKFQDRQVRLPVGDRAIRKDLHSLKKGVTAGGNVRFDADRNEDGHADRTWSLFLAIDAANDDVSPPAGAHVPAETMKNANIPSKMRMRGRAGGLFKRVA